MRQSIALVNLKPGTAKTTCAVWLAHALHEAGTPVLLVDADPAASALEWSDLADSFPFRIVGLATRELHRRVGEFARGDDVVVVDAPQMEDHAGIARSAMRFASDLVIPVAPAGIELNRMSPVRREIDDLTPVRASTPRVSVLLNRVVTQASSGVDTRDVLTDDGWHVLRTVVPRKEAFAQSFGAPVTAAGTAFTCVADELRSRALAGESA